MKTVLICIVVALAIMGCDSSKNAVAGNRAAESKFNDIPLNGINMDAMEPSASKVYLTSADNKFNINAAAVVDKKSKNLSQGINISRDTITFPVTDTLKRFKN